MVKCMSPVSNSPPCNDAGKKKSICLWREERSDCAMTVRSASRSPPPYCRYGVVYLSALVGIEFVCWLLANLGSRKPSRREGSVACSSQLLVVSLPMRVVVDAWPHLLDRFSCIRRFMKPVGWSGTDQGSGYTPAEEKAPEGALASYERHSPPRRLRRWLRSPHPRGRCSRASGPRRARRGTQL
eukprot:6214827-Pleurochrysis_carterae.AAC.11